MFLTHWGMLDPFILFAAESITVCFSRAVSARAMRE
jgi:hypothetical protein